jgi:hypothetical protein
MVGRLVGQQDGRLVGVRDRIRVWVRVRDTVRVWVRVCTPVLFPQIPL